MVYVMSFTVHNHWRFNAFQTPSIALESIGFQEVVSKVESKSFRISTHSPIEIRIQKNPIRLTFLKKDQIVLQDQNGLFYDDTDYKSGTVCGSNLLIRPLEEIYGTGPRNTPPNRRGMRLYTYESNLETSTDKSTSLPFTVPFFFSSDGYGIFVDNYKKGYFDLGKTHADVIEFGFRDSVLSWYFIPGDSTC